MSASDDGCIGQPLIDAELLHDLEALRPQQLRVKYKAEANSHRAMLQRRREGRVIDPAWSASFRAFLGDMGRKPTPEHSIDCLDPDDARYGPGLCRWASKAEQTRNRRNTLTVTWEGERITLAEFAVKIGKEYGRVYYRFTKGDPLGEIAAEEIAPSGPFLPSRLQEDPEKIAAWQRGFATWRARVIRSRRRFARPEVFEIVSLSRKYRRAQAWLTTRGYFELSPDEHHRASELGETPEGRIYRNAPDAIREAARVLIRNDAEVAVKIIHKPPLRYWDYWRWEDWLFGRDGAEERTNG